MIHSLNYKTKTKNFNLNVGQIAFTDIGVQYVKGSLYWP